MKPIRVLAIGDTHCGHVVGLTPPTWWQKRTGDKYHDKHVKIQRQMWNWFTKALTPFKPFDRVIFNGDAIEGKGLRSGGTELITSDRLLQGKMFVQIMKEIDCDKIAMTYGTPSHTGAFSIQELTRIWKTLLSRNLKTKDLPQALKAT